MAAQHQSFYLHNENIKNKALTIYGKQKNKTTGKEKQLKMHNTRSPF